MNPTKWRIPKSSTTYDENKNYVKRYLNYYNPIKKIEKMFFMSSLDQSSLLNKLQAVKILYSSFLKYII